MAVGALVEEGVKVRVLVSLVFGFSNKVPKHCSLTPIGAGVVLNLSAKQLSQLPMGLSRLNWQTR